ncbi:MAG: APC family permease [Ignavibacteria bacterium]|jgi:amino acid transporter|nr:APC family permease [Ignavibacteria bacterium]MCU7498436.1 APC family permease [Ignavibacteria bacterium]MCU7513355.1 APC family permease [Ignavibacteria bacterium]MCU7519989.1 APC family permease [Ignavibacteria bacterium]MCU7523064.1 APC family permease [Ignavibacteria bacterium]
MLTFTYAIINILLVAIFIKVMSKKDFLSYLFNGRWWLTWIAVGIITLMDELTSVYYAPFEAFRFIGIKAIVYIALTSILIRFLSTRMVEISEILEANNIKGGGVYSFSYLVLGPNTSFIAISSIIVSYVLTAAISTVSAVENGTSFLAIGLGMKFFLKVGVIWLITGLNIVGIKENAKFTFLIFVFASFVLVNLIVGGFASFNQHTVTMLNASFGDFWHDLTGGSILHSYQNIIIGIGSCILAYSGIESVLQTASLVKNWKEIRKAYLFLAVTVGIVTPLIALLALSSNVDISKHETDLIPAFATSVNGELFGVIVSVLASITLIMAVNTAMVASAELIEKVAERYNYGWLIQLNKKQSLYRIHIVNGVFYTIILIVTNGSQAILAEMYAVGLIASFCINTGSLIIYRYSKGTKEISYHTSRIGTLILFIILLSTFIYIALNRPYGTGLWFSITLLFLLAGIRISKFRAPEIPVRRATRTPMDIIFAISDVPKDDVHLYFRRPSEFELQGNNVDSIFVSFYSPRNEAPQNISPNHFWISIQRGMKLFDMIVALLRTLEYEMPPDKTLHIHFGWPLSSWLDRMSIGVMIYNIIHLPKKFPHFTFHMDYKAV